MQAYYANFQSPFNRDSNCNVANMAFNMGRGKLNEFNQFRQHLQNDNWDRAMQEMLDSDWSGQVGNRALRLGKVMETNNSSWFPSL